VIDTNVWLARTEDLRYGRLCAFCKRQAIVAGRPRREAFPDGIPRNILSGQADIVGRMPAMEV